MPAKVGSLGRLEENHDEVIARLETWEAAGRNVSEASRQLGVKRSTVRHTLLYAVSVGLLQHEDIADGNVPKRQDYMAARTAKIAAFQKKQRKGDWRKPVLVQLPARPFRLKAFGDPHLDADGCNFELFEKHWMEMNPSEGVYGVCVGDWFDNWIGSLSHLWKEKSTAPSDAWTVFAWLMEQRGDGLIAACSGNHDDWAHGPTDPVDLEMKRHGVRYRKGAIRLAVAFEGCETQFWAIRHKWKGYSMYSAAHGIVRSAIWGWRDNLMIGGHIHQDEPRLISFPDGFRSHVAQISAFKEYDDYPDIHGMMGPRISPVWDFVIDPRLPDTSPDKYKAFWDSESAQGYMEWARSREV